MKFQVTDPAESDVRTLTAALYFCGLALIGGSTLVCCGIFELFSL